MNKRMFLLLAIFLFLIAFWLRFLNLDQPAQYLFDEDLYVYSANLIRKGDKKAFEWWHPPDTSIDSPYQYRPPAVEWLHPPLSKYAIAKSIAIFGDLPWTWRLPSAIAGVSLVLAIGWLAHALFDKKSITLLTMGIAAIESFLVVQSRLASADIFVALFTTAALASFAQWQMKNWRWGLPFAGILAGLAMSSKWSGGLIILTMVVLLVFDFFRKQRYSSVKPSVPSARHPVPTQSGSASSNTVTSHAKLVNDSAETWVSASSISIKQLFLTLSPLIFLPFLIYLITFLPALNLGHSPNHILELHHQAWQYHSTNRAAHPNSSPAYLWLLNQKPVWYYFNEETSQSVKAQASPVIFWGSMVAVLWSVVAVVYSCLHSSAILRQRSIFQSLFKLSPKENQALLTLLVAFLILWLPWLFVSRPTFYYHFLPCMPLLITLLSYWAFRSFMLWLSTSRFTARLIERS